MELGEGGCIVPAAVLRRYEAAEEVCHALLQAMALGLLEIEDRGVRTFIGEPMVAWAQQAAETGVLARSVEADPADDHI